MHDQSRLKKQNYPQQHRQNSLQPLAPLTQPAIAHYSSLKTPTAHILKPGIGLGKRVLKSVTIERVFKRTETRSSQKQ
ncbi:MAG: hypothetical protein EDM05_62775 [Leptolyngbya sp. IPPAS B-1204]